MRPDRKLFTAAAAVALFAAACGGGGQTSEATSAAEVAAATNETQLLLSPDLATSQLLNTSDGSIANLGDTITGDRAVLVWYWAPN